MFVMLSVRTEPVVSSSVSVERSMAALKQTVRQYFKIQKCRSTEVLSASNIMLYLGLVLDATVQLLLTDRTSSCRRRGNTKRSAYDKLSLSEIGATVEFVTDLMRPRGHAAVFCLAQQFSM